MGLRSSGGRLLRGSLRSGVQPATLAGGAVSRAGVQGQVEERVGSRTRGASAGEPRQVRVGGAGGNVLRRVVERLLSECLPKDLSRGKRSSGSAGLTCLVEHFTVVLRCVSQRLFAPYCRSRRPARASTHSSRVCVLARASSRPGPRGRTGAAPSCTRLRARKARLSPRA